MRDEASASAMRTEAPHLELEHGACDARCDSSFVHLPVRYWYLVPRSAGHQAEIDSILHIHPKDRETLLARTLNPNLESWYLLSLSYARLYRTGTHFFVSDPDGQFLKLQECLVCQQKERKTKKVVGLRSVPTCLLLLERLSSRALEGGRLGTQKGL